MNFSFLYEKLEIMENTVGSLTNEQKSIVSGTLLGDGTLRKRKNTLLEINHSAKQKDYVFWLYSRLSSFVLTPPKLRKSGINRFSFRFTTKSMFELNDFYYSFYMFRGMKIVPRKLTLDPLSIAIWFMDDGSKDRDSYYLNTQQFSIDDQEFLLSILKNFGLYGALNVDKQYFRIRLYKSSVQRFNNIINPYIIQSMRYKILL